MSYPPLHPAHLTSQQQAEEMMDAFMLPAAAAADKATPAPSIPSARHTAITITNINTSLSNAARPAFSHSGVPSSPVSPMLAAHHTVSIPTKSHPPQANPSTSLTGSDYTGPAGKDDDTEMVDPSITHESPLLFHPLPPLHSQSEEQMTREDEEADEASAHPWASESQFDLNDGGLNFASEYIEEYEEEEEPPKPATPAVAMTREEKLAFEEKTKNRKKFAEMRYLTNSLFRCRDCMLAPTDMELGFDDHAPPRRPAARPSVGPGSEYCCVGLALGDALPSDFPIDLVPLIHSYLLTDQPSRSFLTTPPLPSQGSVQCYILKRDTKFELYLEMKNQETFVKMRQAKIEMENQRAIRMAARAAAAAGVDAQPKQSENNADVEMKEEAKHVRDASSSASSSSASIPSVPPILIQSHSMPLPVTITSLDDAEDNKCASRPTDTCMDDIIMETPADVCSPTHSLDYEKLFPERPPQKKMRRVIRSANATPELKGIGSFAPVGSASAAYERYLNGGARRMSEPALFGARSGIRRGSISGASSTSCLTPQSATRRAYNTGAGAASAVSAAVAAALPPSESNMHLHNTRTNAVNSMLKHHAETIISEGKDIFLLCAQRKRSWTGNAYLISSDRDNIRSDGPSFYGKLKSNFGGTEFTATDNGTKSPSRRCIEKLQTHQYPTKSADAPPETKEPQKGTMAQWLSGSSAQTHVRHELACILYDHFFEHCLEKDTPVMMSDRRSVPAHAVSKGDMLMGMHGRPVQVASTEHLTVEAIFELSSDIGRVSITGEHLLTLRVCRNPAITIAPAECQLRVAYFSKTERDWKQVTWPYRALTSESHETTVIEIDNLDLHDGDHADELTCLDGLTNAQLRQFGRAWLESHRGDVLVAGSLVEVKAKDLASNWSQWRMDTDTPLVSAFRVIEADGGCDAPAVVTDSPLADAHRDTPMFIDSTGRCSPFKQGEEATAGATYMLHTPLQVDLPAGMTASGVRSTTLRQLTVAHGVAGLLRPDALGAVMIQLNPRAETGGGVDSLAAEHDSTCRASMIAALSLPHDIIAFGSVCRARWLQDASFLPGASNIEFGETSGSCYMSLTYNGSARRVWFAPHPCMSDRIRAVTRAIAHAHGIDAARVDRQLMKVREQGRVTIRSLRRIVASTSVVNIQISDPVFEERRYVLGNSMLTHNSGSPIRIKVLLPNRAFDLHAEAQVGGSIIKQYKIESDRAEKRKLELEAKAASNEEARKRYEATHDTNTNDEDARSHTAMSTSTGDSSSSTSASSSSAAVVPAFADVTVDINADCSIDQYENLRPVWHDGMNAYVLHFDHHRVREKSVKNFKLVRTIPDPNGKTPGATTTTTVLQFGRVLDRNTFVMDYAYPLSALAAFAICLSSIDPKLAV